MCGDCGFWDEEASLDKCPYCRGDDWQKLYREDELEESEDEDGLDEDYDD